MARDPASSAALSRPAHTSMCSGRLSASCAAPPVGSALPEGRLAAEGERMPGRAPPLIERPLQFSAHRSSALLVPNLPEGRLAGPRPPGAALPRPRSESVGRRGSRCLHALGRPALSERGLRSFQRRVASPTATRGERWPTWRRLARSSRAPDGRGQFRAATKSARENWPNAGRRCSQHRLLGSRGPTCAEPARR